MADVIDRGVIEIVGDARKLKASIEDAKKSLRTLGEGQRDISRSASASIDRYIGSLHAQNAVVGKSARETELYRLALRGASNEQIKAADTALRFREVQEKNAQTIQSLKSGFIAFGAIAVAALGGAVLAFDRLIKGAGAFQDLAEQVGDTAESFASLAVAAAVGGVQMTEVAAASIKLTKGLTGVDDESEAAGAALKALGLNIEQFKALKPADQFEAVAKALDGFQDGAAKTAVAVALFGKAGAQMLPFLKELAGETGRQAILTREQIQLADEHADKQARITKQIELHAQAIATDLLPQITEFKKGILDLVKQFAELNKAQGETSVASEILGAALKAVTVVFQTIAVVASDVGFVLLGVGREIGAIAAQAAALARLDFQGFKAISEAVKEDGVRARAELDKFQAAVMRLGEKNQFSNVKSGASTSAVKPQLNFSGAVKKKAEDNSAEQLAKAQLQFDLERIKEAGSAQIDAFKNAESIMQALRSASLVDDRDYFASKLGFIQAFAREEESQLQAQIERRQREVFTGKNADKDRLDNEREIAKLQAQIAKVRADAVAKSTVNSIEEQAAIRKIQQAYEDAKKAAEAYLDTIARRNAREIQGIGRGQRFREAQAGLSDIDERFLAERRRLEGELRRGQLGVGQEGRDRFNQYLAVAEDTYRKEVDLYQERTRAIEAAQADWMAGASEALQNYVDQTRDVAKQFEDAFGRAFQNIEDFALDLAQVNFKSFKDLKDGFTKFVGSIAADLARIEIKERITGPLAEFAKQNLPGIGGLIGRPVGGAVGGTVAKAGTEAANAAQFSTAVTAAGTTVATSLTSAGTAVSGELTAAGTGFAAESTAAGASITAAAASFSAEVIAAGSSFAATVAGSSGASGGAGLVGGLFGEFATGTPYVPQTGPYLLHQGERVIPASQNTGGMGDINIMVNMPATDRATANQTAVEIGRQVQLAQGRRLAGGVR